MAFKNYYTQTEASQLLGISRMTLYRWVKAEKVRPITVWGKPLLHIAQIRRIAVKHCRTCYHSSNNHCLCRELPEVETRRGRCTDWSPIDELA